MTQLLTEPTLTIDEHGVHEWRLDGVLHRLDGPARIWDNDDEEWLFDGRYHRIGGPAIVYADGDKE